MKPLYIILFMLGLACNTALALSFRTVEARHGLRDNYVRDIARDSSGFIWIATQTGLCRFDGNHIKDMTRGRNFTTNPHTIAVDGRDNIWVMTDDSLFVYAGGYFDNAANCRVLPEVIRSGRRIVPDGKEGIWILKTDSLYYLDYNGNKFIGSQMPFVPKDAAAYSDGIALLSPDGNLYIRKRKDRRLQKLGTQCTRHARMIINGSRCWFFDGMVPGVDFYDFTNLTDDISPYPYFGNVLVKDIAEDSKGCRWFGTNNDGIYCLDSADRTVDVISRSNAPYSLSSNHISALYIDHDMIVAGTSKQGASLASFSIPEFDIVDTGVEGDISFLLQSEGRELVIGFDGCGMAVCNREAAGVPKHIYTTNNSALPSDLVIGVSRGPGTTLYGTYGGGIFSMSADGVFIPVATTDSLRYCRHIISEANGTVWAGTFQNGLFNLEGRNYNKDNSELQSDCITGLSKMGDKLLVATSNGLSIVDTTTGNLVRCSVPELAGAGITAIFNDSRGLLWVGTQSGLIVADSVFHILDAHAVSNSFPSGIIRAIAEDHQGRIWVTTPTGISYIGIKRDAAGEYVFDVKSLTEYNGIADMNFSRYSLTCTSDGMILAGGFRKYLVVNAGKIQPVNCRYKAYVTDVYVNGTPVVPGQKVKGGGIPLSADIMACHVVELDYYNNLQLAIGSSAPAESGIRYESRFDGGEWTMLQSDILAFGEVAPGTHMLEVRVVGNNEATAIQIRINPPFYKSNVAYALYAVSAIALCLGFYYNLRKRHKRALGDQRIENAIARQEDLPLSSDDKFITDAKRVVEENIEQEDFSVEKMSELLSMSRSGLYKKMTAIAGQTPLEFMRMVRMREGRRLLDSGESSIAQIAYLIGMSPKQFSKYFKDETGVTPSQYLRELKNK